MRRKNSYIFLFSPIFVFFLGVIYFFFIPAVYTGDVNIYSSGLFAVWALAFSLGYFLVSLVVKKRAEFYPRYEVPRNTNYLEWLFAFLFFSMTIYSLLFFSQTGVYSDNYIVGSQIYLYLKLFDKIWIVILLFFISLFACKGRIFFYAVFLFSIFYAFLDGTRLFFIFSALYWILFGVTIGFLKIRVIYLILAAFILPFLFAFLLIKRLVSYEGNVFGFFHYLYKNISLSDLSQGFYVAMETFVSYDAMNYVINDNLIAPLSGYLRVFLMPIPRSLWSDKPESISRVIAREYYPSAYDNGGGQIAGPIGDGLINGGVVSLAIIWVLLGALSCYMYSTFRNIAHSSCGIRLKAYYTCWYFVFFSYFIYCIRGFGSDFFWVFVLQMITVILIGKKFLYRTCAK
jgi:oligosaccharide repeat unit polymerase